LKIAHERIGLIIETHSNLTEFFKQLTMIITRNTIPSFLIKFIQVIMHLLLQTFV